MKRAPNTAKLIKLLLLAGAAIMVVVNVIFILELSWDLGEGRGETDLDTLDELTENNPHRTSEDLTDLQGPTKTPLHEKEAEKKKDFRYGAITAQLYTSKEHAHISIDGTMVLEYKGEQGRGMNLAVLHQGTGVVMTTGTYDVWASTSDSEALRLLVQTISDGRILCFLSKDEGSQHLTESTRSTIKRLGSVRIEHLSWRDSWLFVVQKGGQVYHEGIHHSTSPYTWPEPLTRTLTIPLHSPESSECHWPDTEQNRRRKVFCNLYEGYGQLCSSTNPLPLDVLPEPFPDGSKLGLPVAVIASNRPHYLYRMLTSLLAAQGAQPSLVTVFIDGFHDEPLAVTHVLGMRGIQHTPISRENARISQHYKASLRTAFNLYPTADCLVILEEDLDLSVDIFSYFHQLIPVLEQDESLYCISAWNDQGYKHAVSGDPSLLYRVDFMPGLGWILKKKLFKEELEPQWPGPDRFWDWDWWMRWPEIRRDRECVIPDLSRTYHFGTRGVSVAPYFQDLYFFNRTLNTEANVRFDVHNVTKDNYENVIENLIRKAEVLDHSKSPCAKDFIPDTKGKTYLLFIKMSSTKDWRTWQMVAKCFKIWDLDNRGFHHNLYRVWNKKNQILVIGYPASPYSTFKPQNVAPII